MAVFIVERKLLILLLFPDTYEYNVKKFIERLSKKSDIIVDVGANIGKYSILACKLNPNAKVFGIEPEKENFEILEKNKKLNNCENLEFDANCIKQQKPKS
jgi:tRNA1(Val) A37 N6-methylase TrmN6